MDWHTAAALRSLLFVADQASHKEPSGQGRTMDARRCSLHEKASQKVYHYNARQRNGRLTAYLASRAAEKGLWARHGMLEDASNLL